MSKLSLTEERTAIIAAAAGEWLRVALSTEPADFPTAEAAVARLYAGAGLACPPMIRLPSPAAAELFINLVIGLRVEVGEAVWDRHRIHLLETIKEVLADERVTEITVPSWQQLWAGLRGRVAGRIGTVLGDQLDDRLGGDVWNRMNGQMWFSLYDLLRKCHEIRLRAAVRRRFDRALVRRLERDLQAPLNESCWRGVARDVNRYFQARLGAARLRWTGTSMPGAWAANVWGVYDVSRRLGATFSAGTDAALTAHVAVVRSCGHIYTFDDFCLLSDRPSVLVPGRRNRAGPTARFRDGFAVLPPEAVADPG